MRPAAFLMNVTDSVSGVDAPSGTWEHYRVWRDVRSAIGLIRKEFDSAISVSGVSACDLHTWGSVLSATVEIEVVKCLNGVRDKWDGIGEYSNCSFRRQAERYPDVVLACGERREDIVLGIEIKSWYVMAKEGEPSFRFKTTLGACPPQDFLLVVPWSLSNVLSGTPVVFDPYLTGTRTVALQRNRWWTEVRKSSDNTDISIPGGVEPYPGARENIADEAASDAGGNFGRLARMGMFDEYMKRVNGEEVAGVAVSRWQQFLREF